MIEVVENCKTNSLKHELMSVFYEGPDGKHFRLAEHTDFAPTAQLCSYQNGKERT